MKTFSLRSFDLRYQSDTGRYYILCGYQVVKVGSAPGFPAAVAVLREVAR